MNLDPARRRARRQAAAAAARRSQRPLARCAAPGCCRLPGPPARPMLTPPLLAARKSGQRQPASLPAAAASGGCAGRWPRSTPAAADFFTDRQMLPEWAGRGRRVRAFWSASCSRKCCFGQPGSFSGCQSQRQTGKGNRGVVSGRIGGQRCKAPRHTHFHTRRSNIGAVARARARGRRRRVGV